MKTLEEILEGTMEFREPPDLGTLFPYFHEVPRDLQGNLEYRRCILEKAEEDQGFQDAIRAACKADLLFFMNTMLWVLEPRNASGSRIPFITWDAQNEFLYDIVDCLGKEPRHLTKSREMGASWGILALFLWRWQFYDSQKFGLASRKNRYVDQKGEEDSLFGKLDFLLEWQPRWLKPPIRRTVERTEGTLQHPWNSSSIVGDATKGGDLFRGGRKLAVLWDEMAACEDSDQSECFSSLQNVTDCVLYVSTPKGDTNKFAEIRNTVPRLYLHWKDNPRYNKGMYCRCPDTGEFWYKDENYKYPEGFEFKATGTLRSPAYDLFQDLKGMTDVEMAQEFDMDFVGSGSVFFPHRLRKQQEQIGIRPPVWQGEVQHEVSLQGRPRVMDVELKHRKDGPLKLWIEPQGAALMTDHDYIIGCDLSWGKGASNSAACILDKNTGEKVGMFCTPFMAPSIFAEHVVALCKIFNQAHLIWEKNGPGDVFGDRVTELGYSRIYRGREESKEFPTTTNKPGWHNSPTNKLKLFERFVHRIRKGYYLERCEDTLRELSEYRFDGKTILHPRSKTTDDDAGNRENHGDRAIASAVACWLHSLFPNPVPRGQTKAPHFSLAWFDEQEEEQKLKDRQFKVINWD